MVGRHRNWQRRTWVTRLRRIGLLVVAPLGLLVGAAVIAPVAPAGMFGLTEGFGQLKNPGTRLAYRYINYSDSWWWVSDTRSSLYNKPAWCPPASCGLTPARAKTWAGSARSTTTPS
jgi:L,D-peptidoglycan transpeptidase YkuD (ErfK/YbiS/YcfS/YnhG family)